MAGKRRVIVPYIGTLLFLTAVTCATSVSAADWAVTDIGGARPAGSASKTDGVWTIAGGGDDIWGDHDSFTFLHQVAWQTDGHIVARLNDLTNPHPFAKAGLMVRSSLAANAATVIVDVKPNHEIEFMHREVPGAQMVYDVGAVVTVPVWLELRWTLRGGSDSGTGTYDVSAAFSQDGSTWTTLGRVPISFNPCCNTMETGVAVLSHDPSQRITTHVQGLSMLPSTYRSTDIGDTGRPGSAVVERTSGDAVYTIEGAGADIWGTSDSYHAVQTTVAGDVDFMARVTSEHAADTFAKAGIVLTDNAGPTVIIDIRPNGIIEFMARPSTGAPMAFLAGSAASFPTWLRLTRLGSQFQGFASADGTNWQLLGSATVSMASTINASLAVTSHDVSVLNTATFDHVAVTSSNRFTDLDIGDVGAAGSFQDDGGGHLFINGAGADIWGTRDAFNFWYSGLVGDGTMSIRVMAIQNTSPFAKAGVMIRESTDPSSAHVILDARPDGSLEFMTRSSTGAETTFLAGGFATFPVYLSLTRTGSTVTASMSQNGSTWIAIGSTSVTFGPALKGLAVTSHQRGVLANGYFNP